MWPAKAAISCLAALVVQWCLGGRAEVVVAKSAKCCVVVAAIDSVVVVIRAEVLLTNEIRVGRSVFHRRAADLAALKRHAGPANRRHPADVTRRLCLRETASRRHRR